MRRATNYLTAGAQSRAGERGCGSGYRPGIESEYVLEHARHRDPPTAACCRPSGTGTAPEGIRCTPRLTGPKHQLRRWRCGSPHPPPPSRCSIRLARRCPALLRQAVPPAGSTPAANPPGLPVHSLVTASTSRTDRRCFTARQRLSLRALCLAQPTREGRLRRSALHLFSIGYADELSSESLRCDREIPLNKAFIELALTLSERQKCTLCPAVSLGK